jgi:putative ABC transport system substrate-binding protein
LVTGRTCSAVARDTAHRSFDGAPADDPEGQARIAAFRQGLQDLKWAEGSNIRVDIRWGTGDAAAVRANAAELVSLAPDVIVDSNTPPARALKQATQAIPIVFVGVSDPIGDGLITNLSKPGGNKRALAASMPSWRANGCKS